MTYQQEQLAMAAFVATEAHAGQTRKHLPVPYVEHCKRVAEAAAECGLTLDAQMAAYLHDVVEDCAGWTLGTLIRRGFSERTIQLVALLTKPKPVGDIRLYYDAILGDDEAVALKLLDRADNMRDALALVQTNRTWTVAYLQKTKAEFPRLVEAARAARHSLAVRCFGGALFALDTALTPGNTARL